jgi:hypothetical protein
VGCNALKGLTHLELIRSRGKGHLAHRKRMVDVVNTIWKGLTEKFDQIRLPKMQVKQASAGGVGSELKIL